MMFRVKFMILFLVFSACQTAGEKRMVVLINTEHNQILHERGLEQWEPTKSDLETVNQVLKKALADQQLNFLDNPTLEGIESYYRQYVPYINEAGKRIIEVNAFCENFMKEEMQLPKEISNWNWKETYLIVVDGGNCFWKIQINIDDATYYDIRVNFIA